MNIEIDIAGDIVERQELLNGSQILTLEGASADGTWTMSGLLTWNIGLKSNTGEGDLTLVREDGDEVFATLVRGDVADAADGDDADHTFALAYDIDGGNAHFDNASGSITATGTLTGDVFRGRWSLTLAD